MENRNEMKIEEIASLARLTFSEEEAKELAEDFKKMLEYVETLQKIEFAAEPDNLAAESGRKAAKSDKQAVGSRRDSKGDMVPKQPDASADVMEDTLLGEEGLKDTMGEAILSAAPRRKEDFIVVPESRKA